MSHHHSPIHAAAPLLLSILVGHGAAADDYGADLARAAAEDRYAPTAPKPSPEAALTVLDRLAPADYADGLGAPAQPDRPSTRAVSNALAELDPISSPLPPMSNLAVALSQFFASHETARSPTIAGSENALDIPVAPDDPLAVDRPGGPAIPFQRSQFTGGTEDTGPRQQLNDVTPFFDGSTVYGSDGEREALLRTHDGSGRLRTGPGDTLPVIGGRPAAGDVRADENKVLEALHVLYLREHNRLADAIADGCRTDGLACSGDQVFHTAQAAVARGQQKVFYEEFLPVFLGTDDLRSLVPNKELFETPGLILTEATTAALRVGHTQVPETVTAHLPGDAPRSATIRDCLFFGACLGGATPDEILWGATQLAAEPIDLRITDGLRNGQLATPFAPVPIDLKATNGQRNRDHGLPTFAEVSRVLGFAPTAPEDVLPQALLDIYGDTDPDLMFALFGEPHLDGAYLGKTAAAIWALQFEWLKADPNFYTRLPADDPLQAYLAQTSLSSLIARNTVLEPGDLEGRNLLLAPVPPRDVAAVPLPGGLVGAVTALGMLAGVRSHARRRWRLE